MMRVFLIGQPVAHSLSPAMQNAALRAVGLDWRYELLETPRAELPAAIARLRQADCAGANVTIPHKENILPYLDDCAPRARQIGAVNTIVKHNDSLIGENTDGAGFIGALHAAQVEPRGMRAVTLGAGGAARAVCFALADAPIARLTILNRTRARAETLARHLRAYAPRLEMAVNDWSALENADLIVNATSVGMAPRVQDPAFFCGTRASPLPRAFRIPRGAVVFDLVYVPTRTRLLEQAAAAGARAIGGLGMLAHQGAAAFRLWTGQEPPVEIMLQAARAAIEKNQAEKKNVAFFDRR